ncbi:Uncharacterised protein [Serratia quinivorans]|uniref:hypothetical protein n=1 Tax=Serratia quinivorans TaxID=137545 RepID=UPI002179C978|nr:hypothetical protein [Serratia quinivorans]CAI0848758.1 Uncharacterised protein [Serratia quinivorans]CAI0888104.1 Uncharacterised protein [Serratia quinivorans]CAI1679027.1 Uncharacterised protein [Serratia quinivorans]CAI2079982.1 Uncharacterised protein [Serratia quinivorans]CAI2439273.1 Uncharacterised protein [Serratia quinivorans]
MGKGGSNEVKETENEKAAAQVASQQWDLYQNELRPYENLFMDKVDALNNEQKYADIANDTNLGYQAEFGKARQETATQLAASGLDPSSGKFQGTLDNITSDQVTGQIDTTNRAQSTQADKYVGGLQDVVAMGAGQKADALSGFNSIANTSMQKAQSDAQRSMSNRQATAGVAGALGGAAVRTYGLQDAAAPASSAGSTGVFGGGNSGGQYGVSNTPFGKSTFN